VRIDGARAIMGKSWIFGLLTLTIALGLIGLLAFTSESIHGVVEPRGALVDPGAAHAAPPVEPQTGPMYHGSGLLVTY